jgi:hypothetical protein
MRKGSRDIEELARFPPREADLLRVMDRALRAGGLVLPPILEVEEVEGERTARGVARAKVVVDRLEELLSGKPPDEGNLPDDAGRAGWGTIRGRIGDSPGRIGDSPGKIERPASAGRGAFLRLLITHRFTLHKVGRGQRPSSRSTQEPQRRREQTPGMPHLLEGRSEPSSPGGDFLVKTGKECNHEVRRVQEKKVWITKKSSL